MNMKIVYCGAGMSGKTSNLEYIHLITNPKAKPGATSPSADLERRRICDYLPLKMKSLNGKKVNLQLFSVPGQVFCADSRRKILEGAHGVVFVVDSSLSRLEANLASFDDLMFNLKKIGLESVPLVLQYNKRDALNALSIVELEKIFHLVNLPHVEAMAVRGVGVFETLKLVIKLILEGTEE